MRFFRLSILAAEYWTCRYRWFRYLKKRAGVNWARLSPGYAAATFVLPPHPPNSSECNAKMWSKVVELTADYPLETTKQIGLQIIRTSLKNCKFLILLN
jgi:hypothetical protein